jgi:hypothetical protein
MCSTGSFGCQFSVKIADGASARPGPGAKRISRSQSLVPRRGSRQHSAVTVDDENSTGRPGRLSLDWWATIVSGVVVLLAVAGLLPKIPW